MAEKAAEAGITHRMVSFGQALRASGVAVGIDQMKRFATCLDWVDPLSRSAFYHTARCCLVCRRQDQSVFDLVFERFWGPPEAARARPRKAPRAPRHEPEAQRRPALASFLASKASEQDPEIDIGDRSGTFSAREVLQLKDFAKMSPQELDAARRIVARMRWRVNLRRTRRCIPEAGGERIDLRRGLRAAARQGGAVLPLPRLTRKVKPRPLVVIADISGSMELYARLLLQFFHSLSQAFPDVESFVFGTRLTRVTPHLALRDIDHALGEVAGEVVDWFGGTRIGESLRLFNRQWSRRVLRRGALVLLASDGCEHGDAALLKREVGHLQRRCHRLIWLNPRLGHPEYQPLTEGMGAALPWVDDFLPIHNLQSLEELAIHLESLPAAGGAETRGRVRRAFPLNRTAGCGWPRPAGVREFDQ